MFTTRLNPTKPPAAHRAILERVGAACRELRPVEDACYIEQRPNGAIPSIFARPQVLGLGIDPAHGGAGTDPLLCALAAERIGREGYGPLSVFSAHSASGAAILARWATTELQAQLLPKAARGEYILTGLLPPPIARDRIPLVEVTFQETQAGFLLNGGGSGSAPWSGDVRLSSELDERNGRDGSTTDSPGAGACVVLARDRVDARISAFVVDSAAPGFRAVPVAHALGLPTVLGRDVFFDGCEVPSSNLLGERGAGWDVARTAVLHGRLSVAAGSVGVVADSLEEAITWIRRERSYAPARSTRHLVKRRVARIAVDLEAARALVYAAAALKAEYDRNPASAHLELETFTLVSEAKYFATSAAGRAAARAVQIMGRDGFELKHRPARHLHDTRAGLIRRWTDEALEREMARYYLSS